MKQNRKTGVFLLMGMTALWLTGCSNADDGAKAVAKATPVPTSASATAQSKPEVVMYKPLTCDCCTGWAEHLSKEGFSVEVKKYDDMGAIKAKFGVSEKLASCHTAIVDGYVIEGHVPAADVERLLKERPDIVGLTAPGMPMKSPGMQADGQQPQGYTVLAFDKDGNTTVFHRY